MRVGLVCPYSLTIPGGVQGQVLGPGRSLRSLGHEVRVSVLRRPAARCGRHPARPQRPDRRQRLGRPAGAPDPSAQLRTIRALRDEDFEVLHLHEPMAPGPCITALLMWASRRRSGPSTPRARAPPTATSDGAWRRMARRLDHRCAVSPDAVALAESGLGGTYELLFNGGRGGALRRRPGPPHRRPDDLLPRPPRARARASRCCSPPWPTSPDVRVWVGGDGPQTEELQERVPPRPRIEWLGRISDDERSARMRGCTVYCSPSVRGESFGMVLLEAMASGCALVASDLDGHRNVASDGVDALLAPVGDAAALAKALRRVLDDEALRAELVAGGRRRADQLSMTHLAERYDEIYRRLVPRT